MGRICAVCACYRVCVVRRKLQKALKCYNGDQDAGIAINTVVATRCNDFVPDPYIE